MAVRFAMFAEQALPRLRQAWATRAEPLVHDKHLPDLIKAKAAADEIIAEFEPALFPEGD